MPTDDKLTKAAATGAEPQPLRAAPPDPFDLASLRLGADYGAGLGVKKVIATIPVRKPGKQEWFRCRPGDDWRIQTCIFESEGERETYLVSPSLWAELDAEIRPILLATCINRAGDLFLWPCKIPRADGRSNAWNDSALRIASAAETRWVRMTSNPAGYYQHFEPATDLPDPEWPALALQEIVRIAFRDRMVSDLDHPLVRQLRGQS
jgi:hypothetical protein